MKWSEHARAVVASVLAQHPTDTPERRKALRAAYPFGERKYWPYKAWLKAIRQLTHGPHAIRHDDQHTLI